MNIYGENQLYYINMQIKSLYLAIEMWNIERDINDMDQNMLPTLFNTDSLFCIWFWHDFEILQTVNYVIVNTSSQIWPM